MNRLCMFFLVAILSCAALAQDKDKDKTQEATGAPSAKQSPEMKRLVDTFAGQWKTTTTVFKGDWFPVDGTAIGRAEIQAGPAGNSVVERFSSTGITGNFAGRGVYWWDASASAYRGIWCDSIDPRGYGPVGDGKWERGNLVYNNNMDLPGGAKLQVRETFSNITKTSYDYMIEAVSGGAMKKMMTIRYEKPLPKGTSAAGTEVNSQTPK